MDRLIELFIWILLLGVGFIFGYIAKAMKERDKNG